MKRWLNGALATCSFELRRSFTVQRTAVSLVLALFPPAIMLILILATRLSRDFQAQTAILDFSQLLIIFLVALVCLLTTLLWATPNVYSEMEGKTWGFIASRPGGRVSVFLGKFLASFLVSFGVSVVAISLCIFLVDRSYSMPDAQRLWLSICGVFLLGCLVYSAVFSMFGTLFIKRSMVFAAGYLFGSDVILASIPGALISKLTIRYHLQEIGIAWIGWFLPASYNEADFRLFYGEPLPTWIHLAILLGITAAALALGGWTIVNREYITKDDA